MYSMTGYGRGEYKAGGLELTVEIKTVNNRYLDIALKCPRIFVAYEEELRSLVRGRLTRGHADVFVSYTDKREKAKSIYVDEPLARAYIQASKSIASLSADVVNDFTVTALMRMPDVLKTEEPSAVDEELLNAAKCALSDALDKLNCMREREGGKLAADMLSRVEVVEKLVGKIKERAPLVAQDYKKRLEEKVKSALENVNYDEGRLLIEVAVFTDKSNIDEELTRLDSHISQFREIAKEKLVGRKLDFLVQEFNRETNTICSKSSDITITKLGLELKNEIEKIREQVQNVE